MNYDLIIHEIAPYLERFHKKKTNLYMFRCPLCGDSKKSKVKTRGHIYKKGSEYYFKCFNCGIALTFNSFLKQQFPTIHSRYYLEMFKNQNSFIKQQEKEVNSLEFSLQQFECLKHYSTSKEAVEYIKSRKIPENKLSQLYFISDINDLLDCLPDLGFNKLLYKSSRIVFPVFNKQNSLVGFVCRAIDKTDSLRYFNIKLSEEQSLVYGQNSIDIKKKVFIVEGIIDSLFLDNCLAACSSGFESAILFCKKHGLDYVLIFDNERRNKQITNIMQKHINNNESIVLFNDWNFKGKDINEMFKSSSLSLYSFNKELEKHIVSGLKAKIEFSKWKD